MEDSSGVFALLSRGGWVFGLKMRVGGGIRGDKKGLFRRMFAFSCGTGRTGEEEGAFLKAKNG
jgi:hypothetical protein